MSIQAMTPEQVATADKAVSAPPAAPVTTTTTAPPEPKEPRTLEALKAARREKPTETPKPKDGETTPTEPAKPGKTTTTVDVKLDEGSLAKFTKLNRELEDARKRLKELEPKAATAAKVDQAMKLIASGKSFDGIKDLVGIDAFNQAVKQVIGAEEAVKLTPEAAKLQEELEALKKDNASTKEQLAAAAAAQREVGVARIIEEVKSIPEQFPFLSRSADWVRDALKGADDAFPAANAKCREDNGRDMNDAEKNALLRAALEVAEEDHAKRAKLYAPPEAKKPEPSKKPAPRTVDNTMRSSVTAVKPSRGKATLEQLKAERRGRA